MENNTYQVTDNDSLFGIASKFNTTVGILKALNQLDSNILKPGQILKVPSTLVEEVKPSQYIVYTVKKGDNLYLIAKAYGISLEDLINFNEKGNTFLQIGEQLLIPKPNEVNTSDISYVVKPGDTLYNIAKRYNTSVDELKATNNLTTNLLKIGETLIIPNTKNYQAYVVRTNDTLDSISDSFNISKEEILRINNLLTDDISVGQIILIP